MEYIRERLAEFMDDPSVVRGLAILEENSERYNGTIRGCCNLLRKGPSYELSNVRDTISTIGDSEIEPFAVIVMPL